LPSLEHPKCPTNALDVPHILLSTILKSIVFVDNIGKYFSNVPVVFAVYLLEASRKVSATSEKPD
jgi:hypothetical protein